MHEMAHSRVPLPDAPSFKRAFNSPTRSLLCSSGRELPPSESPSVEPTHPIISDTLIRAIQEKVTERMRSLQLEEADPRAVHELVEEIMFQDMQANPSRTSPLHSRLSERGQ